MITTTNPPNGRGCGDRDAEMPYACCGLSADGLPIEKFFIDPCIMWPGDFQRGSKVLPRNPQEEDSVNDVIIFVGKEYYPSAWSFVEEAKRFGVSRKLPRNFPFNELTPGESRMLCCHAKAIPTFSYKLNRDPGKAFDFCMFEGHDSDLLPGHHPDDSNSTCMFALNDLSYQLHEDAEIDEESNTFMVSMPSFDFTGIMPKLTDSQARYQIGLFLALPLSHIEYKDSADNQSKRNAEQAGFDTVILDH